MRIVVVILLAFASLTGCVKRRISISSNPEGALVWVNDREVGRTPLQFEFLYYGEYDLRLERVGFEPIMTTRWAVSPIWEAPVVDLFAELLSPNRESLVQWHFELEPRNDDPELLLDRAKTLRGVSQERHGE